MSQVDKLVLYRVELHSNTGGSEKAYLVEVLRKDNGDIELCTRWGPKGRLTSTQCIGTFAERTLAFQRAEQLVLEQKEGRMKYREVSRQHQGKTTANAGSTNAPSASPKGRARQRLLNEMFRGAKPGVWF